MGDGITSSMVTSSVMNSQEDENIVENNKVKEGNKCKPKRRRRRNTKRKYSDNMKVKMYKKRNINRRFNRNLKRKESYRASESDICKNGCHLKYNFTDRRKIIPFCNAEHVSIYH